jgi:hypothetical protein
MFVYKFSGEEREKKEREREIESENVYIKNRIRRQYIQVKSRRADSSLS